MKRGYRIALTDVELELQFLLPLLASHSVFVLLTFILRLHRNEGSERRCGAKMQALEFGLSMPVVVTRNKTETKRER